MIKPETPSKKVPYCKFVVIATVAHHQDETTTANTKIVAVSLLIVIQKVVQ